MANNLNALSSTASSASQGFNDQVARNTGGTVNRPTYNSVWKRQTSTTSTTSSNVNNQINSPGVQQSPTDLNKHFSFYNVSPRDTNASFDYHSQNSFPSSPSSNNTSPTAQGFANVYEPNPQPYWESEENWNEGQFEGVGHRTGEAGGYSQEYDAYQKPYKKKGLSFKIDRFVQRFPTLNKFYKQPATSPSRNQFNQQFSYNSSAEMIDSNDVARELTADELALHPRYSDKTHIKLINLQRKDETQPVDLRIHHEKNLICLCDVGRSVVEIYDLNGVFQHSISDPAMLKFQPTAVAVASDGTVILASHFNHCLHMYTPNDSPMGINQQLYKQFKLGSEGNQIHQFYQPAGIAIDHSDGYLYVCDRGNNRLQVIRPEGFCDRVIQLFLNTRKKYPLDPIRVAIQKQSDFIVCIVGTGDAICFIPKSANGKMYVDPLYIFDENGLGLENASGLAVDNQDRIYIADTGHHRIVICTPEGHYITSFGSQGDGLGQLKRPCGLDVTNNGIVVVTDPGNKRLHLFGLTNETTSVENHPPKENSIETEQSLINHL